MNKKQLYENIMKIVSKQIIKSINEYTNKFDLDDFDNTISDNDIMLNKYRSPKSAVQKSILNEENYLFIKKNFVDLNLPSGILWCKFNIGASKPEEFGDYYAWGETEYKYNHTWENYKFNILNKAIKYNSKDNIFNLDLEDDAAYQTDHRMCIPTKDLFDELIKYTDNEWTECNSVKGRIFRSKINPNNFIFIPASGFSGSGDSFYGRNSYCCCWTSLLHLSLLFNACNMFFNTNDVYTDYDSRYLCFTIRPVLKK